MRVVMQEPVENSMHFLLAIGSIPVLFTLTSFLHWPLTTLGRAVAFTISGPPTNMFMRTALDFGDTKKQTFVKAARSFFFALLKGKSFLSFTARLSFLVLAGTTYSSMIRVLCFPSTVAGDTLIFTCELELVVFFIYVCKMSQKLYTCNSGSQIPNRRSIPGSYSDIWYNVDRCS